MNETLIQDCLGSSYGGKMNSIKKKKEQKGDGLNRQLENKDILRVTKTLRYNPSLSIVRTHDLYQMKSLGIQSVAYDFQIKTDNWLFKLLATLRRACCLKVSTNRVFKARIIEFGVEPKAGAPKSMTDTRDVCFLKIVQLYNIVRKCSIF